jgi:hypothetical protein
MLTHKRKKPGQSLVEFALTATLMFMMLSAIIDLGLAYFAYQGLAGAAQEGASYAALFPNNGNVPNDPEIRQRVRYEAGANISLPHRAQFVDLLDLNNNNKDDNTELTELNKFVLIQTVQNSANAQLPAPGITCDSTSTPPRRTTQYCDMVVTVKYVYKPFFSGASLFGAKEITLSATRSMTISR